MFVIDSTNKIRMVRGDTGCIRLQLVDYPLSDGDEVRFGVTARNVVQPATLSLRDTGSELIIAKSVTEFEEDGSARIILEGEDTQFLNPGNYLYEIEVRTKDGRIDTVVTTTRLTILEGIIGG
jgi:hypothetical protein